METPWKKIFLVVVFIVMGLMVFDAILMPVYTRILVLADEPMSTLDCIEGYTGLWGSLNFMRPFLNSAPKHRNTYMLKDPCELQRGRDICQTWFRGAKSDFKKRLGEQFIKALENTQYLERQTKAGKCDEEGACTCLESCLDNGRKAIDPEDTTLSIEEENDIILDCLQIANYILRRNAFLQEQAETTIGPLTNTWLEAPP